jgi:hypothetical protein
VATNLQGQEIRVVGLRRLLAAAKNSSDCVKTLTPRIGTARSEGGIKNGDEFGGRVQHVPFVRDVVGAVILNDFHEGVVHLVVCSVATEVRVIGRQC